MRHFVLVISVLLLPFTAFAQTYSNASLNGSYAIQTAGTQYDSWSKTASCMYNGQRYTATAGGQGASTQSYAGVIVFDGAGNLTATYTQSGTFDQTLSDATVVITFNSKCKATINNGYAVFDPPSNGSATGTYSVQSTGSGTLTFSGQSGSVTFELAGTTAANISNTVFFTFLSGGTPNEVSSTGTGMRQLLSE